MRGILTQYRGQHLLVVALFNHLRPSACRGALCRRRSFGCSTSAQPWNGAGPPSDPRVQPAPSPEAACNGRLEMDVTFPEYQ